MSNPFALASVVRVAHASEVGPAPVATQVPAAAKADTSPRLTRAREALAARARSVASTLTTAVGALERSAQEVADRAGISRSLFRRYLDADDLQTIPISVLEADPELARAVYVARLAVLSAAAPVSPSLECCARRATGAVGAFNADLDRALADGELSRDELLDLLRDGQRLVDESNAACRSIRKLLGDPLPPSPPPLEPDREPPGKRPGPGPEPPPQETENAPPN